MTISALRTSSVRRWFSRRSFWISSSCGLRLDLGLRLWGVKPLRMPAWPFAAPRDQVRGVEALAAQQGADGSGFCRSVGLGQDPLLILGGEGPSLGGGDDLRVGMRRYRRKSNGGRVTRRRLWSVHSPSEPTLFAARCGKVQQPKPLATAGSLSRSRPQVRRAAVNCLEVLQPRRSGSA